MPVIRILPGGGTLHFPPARNVRPSAKRGTVASWSARAAARNTAFLRASPAAGYDDGDAYAATLTYQACPDSHEILQSDRKQLLDRLRRMGAIRAHWVVEFTRKGTPHLHLTIWLPRGTQDASARVTDHWLAITADRGTRRGMQPVKPLRAFGGWAAYVAKHAARGAEHYQRRRDSLPDGWKSTGRLWGRIGSWSLAEPRDVLLSDAQAYTLRRVARRLEMAATRRRAGTARTPRGGPTRSNAQRLRKAWAAFHSARRSLRLRTAAAGRVRGLSIWADPRRQAQLLRAVGYDQAACQKLGERAALDRAALADRLAVSVC